MLKNELMEIISNRENSEIEFKRDDLRPEQLAKEIVAFANGSGGRIIIGVEDDGTITGITRNKLEEWIMDTVCTNYIHPYLIPKYEEIKLDSAIKVAVISVMSGISTPYVVKNNRRQDVYVRVGSISRLATREQIIHLSGKSGILNIETMPVPNTTVSSLDMIRVENYFNDIIKDPQSPKSESEWIKRLKDMGFMTDNIYQKNLCTIAGLVLFGINPKRYLKQSGVRLMVFDSADKIYKAQLDTVIDGPLLGRWKLDKSGNRSIVDDGVIEKVASQILPFITEESNFVEANFQREKVWLYPLEAIRELILNAFAHRDWTKSVDIEICIYNNRIEIVSPGALPNSMTIEKMVAGRRVTRNPIIMEVLKDYQYVDSRGMGIRIKVIPILMQFNGTSPTFITDEDCLKTIIYAKRAITDPNINTNDPNLDPNIGADDPNISTNEPKKRANEPKVDPKKSANDPKKRANEPKADLKKSLNEPKADLKKSLNEPKLDPNINTKNIKMAKILELVKSDSKVTYKKLAESCDCSVSTIKRLIKDLKEEGKLDRIGKPFTGYWKVLDS